MEFGVCLTNYVDVTSKEASVGTARLSGQIVGLLGWPQSVRGQSASLIPPYLAAYVNVRTASSDTFCDAGELPSPRRCHCLARAVNPHLHAYVVDAKEPLAIAKPLVEAHHLQDRITLIEGNMHTIDLEKDHDVVLISGVVLIKSEDDCRHIFRRSYDALKPGGLIIVQDFMRIDHSEKRRFLDTMMDMYVVIGFDPGASDRYGADYAAWLHDTGFDNIKQIPLPTQLAIIRAEKPSAPV